MSKIGYITMQIIFFFFFKTKAIKTKKIKTKIVCNLRLWWDELFIFLFFKYFAFDSQNFEILYSDEIKDKLFDTIYCLDSDEERTITCFGCNHPGYQKVNIIGISYIDIYDPVGGRFVGYDLAQSAANSNDALIGVRVIYLIIIYY